MFNILTKVWWPRKRLITVTAAIMTLFASVISASADSVVQYTVGTGYATPSLYLYSDLDFCNYVAFSWNYWMSPQLYGSSSSVDVFDVNVSYGSATYTPDTLIWVSMIVVGSDGSYQSHTYYPFGPDFIAGSSEPTINQPISQSFTFTHSIPAYIQANFSDFGIDANCRFTTQVDLFPY